MKKILILGGVAAGTSAASQAKKTDPTAQVSLIQDESVISYGSCGIPYVIEGVVESFEKLIIRSPQVFKEKQQIDIITNTKVTKIDPKKKIVYATNTNSGKQVSFDYDSLVIATGARAIIPPIKGIDQQGVFTVRSYSDGVKLRESTKESKSCILVGAGLVGLEMAEAYKKNGLDVTIIEMADRVLPNMLNKNFSNIVSSHLKDNGVKLRLGEKVEEIMTKEDLKVVKTDRGEITGNFVLVGTGVKPNSEIAKDAGIELGVAGAIKVDEYMHTNLEGIFATGDCATAKNYVTGKENYLPLGTTANKQGRIAGRNAAGKKFVFKGIAGSAITKAFDLYVGKTGLSYDEAKDEGFDPVEKEIEGKTRASYYPGSKPIWINLVADRNTGKLLGSQIVGTEFVKGRIDQIALALLLKANLDDIENFDWCYVPPTSPVWDPLNIAAMQIAKDVKQS